MSQASLLQITIFTALFLGVAYGVHTIFYSESPQEVSVAPVDIVSPTTTSTSAQVEPVQVPVATPTPTPTPAPASAKVDIQDTVVTSNNVSTVEKKEVVLPVTSTILDCNDDWQCLISAARTCKSASGAVSYKDVEHHPLIPGALVSGRTQFEIKKSGNECSVIYSTLNVSVNITEKDRSESLARGVTNSEIDAEFEMYNNNLKNHSINIPPTTCVGDANGVASFVQDLKNGDGGNGEVNASWSSSMTVSIMDITTSAGKKIACSTQLEASPF
jgi:hypothetical protein